MKNAPQPLLNQASALDAYVEAMMLPQSVAASSSRALAGDTRIPSTTGGLAALPQMPVADPTRIRLHLFKVAGLTLALPVDAVKGAAVIAAPETLMQQQKGWWLGTHNFEGVQATIVDTARLVLPAERAALLACDPSERSRHLLVIDDGRWALSCTAAGEIVELDRAAITWRSPGGKRPWLAGMAAEQGYALLDVDGLTQLLTAEWHDKCSFQG